MKLLDTNSSELKIKGWDVYSTTETPIGTWIDGGMLYRRVVTAKLSNASSWSNLVDISSWKADKIVQLYGYTNVGTGDYSKRIPMYETSAYYINVARYGNYIKYMSAGHSRYSVVLVVEYTKTS